MATPLHSSSAPQHVSLSNHDKQQLVDFTARYCSNTSELTDLQVLALVQRHPVALPSIQASLEVLARNQISHLLIQNLPIDSRLPAPPSNGVRPAGKGWLSEVTVLSLLQAAGLSVFAYCEERNGSLIQEVAPAKLRARELSSLGAAELGMHSDKGFLPLPFQPEFLCLHGLLNETSIPTMIADLSLALAHLKRRDPALESLLWQPRFRLAKPACLRSGDSKPVFSDGRPLIAESQGVARICGNLSTLRTTDEVAEDAVAAFQASIAAVAAPILLNQGVGCLINNNLVLHGRGAIHHSGRWLQRAYARTSLEDLRHACARPSGNRFPLSELIKATPCPPRPLDLRRGPLHQAVGCPAIA